ncbi:carotenoid oxygenase [Umbelopsis sp. AD052]|nr:carotenoid oxygenase [Umbelopsis sp. AD052]
MFKNTTEIPQQVALPVNGQLPAWLNGTLFRIGPGKFNIKRKDGSYMHIRHAFDGLPYLHRFVFSAANNQIQYNSRNLSQEVERKLADDEDYPLFFGHSDPATSVFIKLYRAYKRLRSASVENKTRHPSDAMVGVTATPNFPLGKDHLADVRKVGDQVLVAKTDANLLQLIDVDSLVPKKIFDYTTIIPEIQGQLSAAHHQTCPYTKELFNIVLSFGRSTTIKVFSINQEGKGTLYGDIVKRLHDNVPVKPSYIHSFALTQNYIVIPEYPLYFAGGGLPILLEGTIEAAFAWDSTAKTYFHVVSRESKKHVATIEANPAFAFHMGNCWEDAEGIHFECGAFPNGDIAHQLHTFGKPVRKAQFPAQNNHIGDEKQKKSKSLTLNPPRQSSFGDLRRYTIPYHAIQRGSGQAAYKDIAPNVEFPRFNAKMTGKPSRYVWACKLHPATVDTNETVSVVKVDTSTGKTVQYYRPGYYCSEPIFVPKPGAENEDDGIVVSLANEFHESDESLDRCYVVILDGETLEELGRAEIGDITPVTFHGSFVDKDFQDVSVN